MREGVGRWWAAGVLAHPCEFSLHCTEPEFLNFYGAQESIPRNQFRQPMYPGGPVRQPYSYSVPSPYRLFKNTSTVYRLHCSVEQSVSYRDTILTSNGNNSIRNSKVQKTGLNSVPYTQSP